MICIRCGSDRAYTEVQVARVGFPPLPPGICMGCALEDPATRAAFDAWMKELPTHLGQVVREAIGRSLEAIDELVGRLL